MISENNQPPKFRRPRGIKPLILNRASKNISIVTVQQIDFPVAVINAAVINIVLYEAAKLSGSS
jgi:hypothetical protein